MPPETAGFTRPPPFSRISAKGARSMRHGDKPIAGGDGNRKLTMFLDRRLTPTWLLDV